MIKLYENGVYLLNGTEIVEDNGSAQLPIAKEEAAKNTMAYGILNAHNTSGNMENLQIKFDKLTSHDITFVGIIQTARASGLEKFPIPYVLTNCHNSLCAVGGTINEDDHMFGLTCAKKYGGVYVPPHQAVIHQFAREMLAGGGKMILGSDSHTRYGALGTMAMGEGGPELVKQLLNKTYDIKDEVEDKEEKDAIRIAIQETMIANNNGKLEKISFEKKLKQHLDIINFEYDENTKKYKFVSFKSGIEYEVNEKGEIL